MRSDATGSFLALGALALALTPAPAVAQTRFVWPDTAVQVAEYTTVEQCLAAVHRTKRNADQREALTVWRDTLPPNPRFELDPPPAPVKETARRCAERFDQSMVSLDDFAPMLRLYLAAGRDADARALVARRLAAVPVKDARARTAVGDTAVRIYLDARPVRLEAAEDLLLARGRTGDRLDRMELYSRLLYAAKGAGDTTLTQRWARAVVAVADSLTTAERESEKFAKMGGGNGGRVVVFGALQELTGMDSMLDSLRRSTTALQSLMRSMWATGTGERPEAMPIPIGERAPAIEADFWLPSAAADGPYPEPGRVSLVTFLNHDQCLRTDNEGGAFESSSCGAVLAKLRRLGERFPKLAIVIVTRTHGSFLYATPPSPAEEAEMIRRWLEPYRIPRLTVAVTSTSFRRLPRPDARRIDEETPTRKRYRFGQTQFPPSNEFLIDQDGLIVTAVGTNESDLARFIEVLMQRGAGEGHNAAK